MNPQDTPKTSSVIRPDEQVICEIRRHPIGIFGMYVTATGLLLVMAVVAFAVAPSIFSGSSRSQVLLIGALVLVIAAAISAGFILIAQKVYWGNVWVVTNESITQVKRLTLFDKQTSQLSFGNLEDVTAEQDGVWQQMFHYGTISAETAAATDKFTFMYCPNPNYYVQTILESRERFEQERRNSEAQTPAPLPPVA